MCWGGLSGLIAHIKDTIMLDNDKLTDEVVDEIVSKYPLTKSSLKYLFTLYDEMQDEVSELEQENISLKEQIKALESKNPSSSSKDTLELKNRLKTLENENNELKEKITDLQNTLEEYEKQLSLYESFFENSSICSIFYNNFLKKANYVR